MDVRRCVACARVCAGACVSMCMHVCGVCVCACVCAHMCVRPRVRVCVCVHVCAYACLLGGGARRRGDSCGRETAAKREADADDSIKRQAEHPVLLLVGLRRTRRTRHKSMRLCG